MYKIIYNNKVIDVVDTPVFIKILPSGTISFSDSTVANGIIGYDRKTVYCFEPVNRPNTKIVSIEPISQEEFKRLKDLLNSGEIVYKNDTILAAAKAAKIMELSACCSTRIIAGFNVILSNGESYHFKLTTEDQLNLIALENSLKAGDKTFIYHATDKPCQVFSASDMSKIIKAFKAHILYHTTYFNAAKQFINSLAEVGAIEFFTYGTDITNTIDNKHIKDIIKGGGSI